MAFDVVIKNGLHFDGTGAPGELRHLGIRDGRLVVASHEPLDERDCPRVIDAAGKWVTPGFVDLHTHYDAELIASPSLSESVRHGVTTVTVGSCSISAVLSEPEDCSDLFTRVESVPREHVLPLLRERKSWTSAGEYVEFLRRQPLGPNVTTFLGHSDLRTRVMGLERAVDPAARPTDAEVTEMERLLEDALDHGFLGMSTMTNPWDKLDGDRFRSAQLPSSYATWGEYRRLHRVLRRRARILQSAPNIVTKINAFLFMLASAGMFWRKPLRTTLITLADAKSSRGLHRVIGPMTRFVNRVLRGDMRWQTLPVPFEVYADGIDLVVFEEFGAGRAALHLADEVERNELMRDEAYRRRFRRDYEKRFTARVWHRNFFDAFIVACPDASLVGKSFGDVGKARGIHPVDAFLDLVVEHGKAMRWRTTIANDRPPEIATLIKEPSALIGFADSGAHIRNMAFYSFPLRMLRYVQETKVMSIEKAIWRLTGEIGTWLGIDAGRLRVGDRADVPIIDPAALDARLDEYHEARMDGFGDLTRMVNRSDGVVSAVLINGRVAFDGAGVVPQLGQSTGYGTYLGGPLTAVVARRTQQERREGTIRKLLDAATETLIDVGYAQASVQTICDRAEVSQGALFRHFATREELMVAVGEDVGARILTHYRKRFGIAAKRDSDVEAALRLVRDACRSRLNQAWYELEVASRTNETLRKALAPVSRRYFENITLLARELLPDMANALGPTFDILVTSVIALFDGETTHRFVNENKAAEDARFALLVRGVKLLAR